MRYRSALRRKRCEYGKHVAVQAAGRVICAECGAYYGRAESADWSVGSWGTREGDRDRDTKGVLKPR